MEACWFLVSSAQHIDIWSVVVKMMLDYPQHITCTVAFQWICKYL